MPSYTTPGVYIEEVASSSRTLTSGDTAVAAFVGFTQRAPKDDLKNDPHGIQPRQVTNWSQFEELYGGLTDPKEAILPHSVFGFFNNGGRRAYIVRIPHTELSDKSGTLALKSPDLALGKEAVEFATKKPNADITVTIEREPDKDLEPVADASAKPKKVSPEPPTFTISVSDAGDGSTEKYEGVTLADIESDLKKSTKVSVATKIDLKDLDPSLQLLEVGRFAIEPAKGELLKEVPSSDFGGKEAARTGISGLAIHEDVTMVMVPDLYTACMKSPTFDWNLWKSVQLSLITHCELQKNRMAILDTPPDMTPQKVKAWRADSAYDSPFAALYYPWIEIDNPAGKNGNKTFMAPPCGHVAGIWSRTDDTRGVWKAPANETLRGVLGVDRAMTKEEQGTLNPDGINCIRKFGTYGIRVWGARTLSKNTDWTYINVRRLFNMIETAIVDGTQYAVFEPNDQKLWEGLKRTMSAYLRGLWRDGALFGATAEQAFFVKCDEETNPPDARDRGEVVVEVGIAPVKPAEFVIFRISQKKDEAA